MRPISWPLKDLVLPPEKSEKPHPLGARKRPSFNIASEFARSKNPSSKVHKPISLHWKQIQPCDYQVTDPKKLTFDIHILKGRRVCFHPQRAQKRLNIKGLKCITFPELKVGGTKQKKITL